MAGNSGDVSSRSAGVKRLLKEAKELHKPSSLFFARPLEDNLFEWHFTFRGPPDTDYAGGIYHGRIILPNEYPMKPPNLLLLTQNGRFEINTKICLSISGYHPETWLPSWSIRTAILALVAFFPTDGAGALGSIECSSDVRKKLASRSLDYYCETCECKMREILPETDDNLEEVEDDGGTSTPSVELSVQNNPTTTSPVTSHTSTPTSTATDAETQKSTFMYGICILACLMGFFALLIRRLTLH